MTTDNTKAIDSLSSVWTHMTELVIDHAQGAYLYDRDGTEYLDFTSGIGVTNTGHCHPKVVEAAQAQAGKLLHGQANIIFHPPMLELVEELKTVVASPLNRFFFSNSGAEAVEAAIKLARQATKRTNIIVFQGSFHGRTVGTMSMTTSKTIYRVGYQPLMAGVFVAPYPYSYRYGWSDDETVDFCLNELDFLLRSQTAPEETAAIVIEPVLGEGGYVVPPQRFMTALRNICNEHGILLVVDEVQSGFGRTGKFFAHEYFPEAQPDILIMAKGLASGLPLSGIAASEELMSRWIPGSHGGTYGGNAVACAAAAATVRVLRDEGLLDNTQVRGEQLMAGLHSLKEKYPIIGEVRGLGLMIGTEFTWDDGHHGKTFASGVQQACMDENLLLLTCGTYGNVIRWIPPLIVTDSQISHALAVFERALQKIAG